MKKRKLILVLSGGGAKGAFQVGVLKYLYEHGLFFGEEHVPGDEIQFDHIAGISVGSLNGVMIAMDEFQKLEELWIKTVAGHPEEIWTSDFVDENFKIKEQGIMKFLPKLNLGKVIGVLLSKKKKRQFFRQFFQSLLAIKSLASNDPLRKKLDQLLDLKKIKNTIVRVGYVSLKSGEYHSQRHDDFVGDNEDFRKAVLASTAMPVIWSPVKSIEVAKTNEKQAQLVDGGLRNVSPLGDIFNDINGDNDPDMEYYLVIINTQTSSLNQNDEENLNLLKIAFRSLVDITLNEIFLNDIQEFIRINNLVHQLEVAKKKFNLPNHIQLTTSGGRPLRRFYHKIVQPAESLGDTLDFGKEAIEKRLALGYETAQRIFATPQSGARRRPAGSPPFPWDA